WTAASASTTATKHLHLFGDDLQFRPLLTVFFPRVKLQSPFDQHTGALVQVLVGNLGGATPKGDVDKGRFIGPLVTPLHPVVYRQPNVGYGRSTSNVAQFRVPGQVADQDDTVVTSHGDVPS